MAKRETVDIIIDEEMVAKIEFTNSDGEPDHFYKVALPEGADINGEDLAGWEFSPKFVNTVKDAPSLRCLPLLADREVWLSKAEFDEDGHILRDESGKPIRQRKNADPHEIKRIFDEYDLNLDDIEDQDIPF